MREARKIYGRHRRRVTKTALWLRDATDDGVSRAPVIGLGQPAQTSMKQPAKDGSKHASVHPYKGNSIRIKHLVRSDQKDSEKHGYYLAGSISTVKCNFVVIAEFSSDRSPLVLDPYQILRLTEILHGVGPLRTTTRTKVFFFSAVLSSKKKATVVYRKTSFSY